MFFTTTILICLLFPLLGTIVAMESEDQTGQGPGSYTGRGGSNTRSNTGNTGQGGQRLPPRQPQTSAQPAVDPFGHLDLDETIDYADQASRRRYQLQTERNRLFAMQSATQSTNEWEEYSLRIQQIRNLDQEINSANMMVQSLNARVEQLSQRRIQPPSTHSHSATIQQPSPSSQHFASPSTQRTQPTTSSRLQHYQMPSATAAGGVRSAFNPYSRDEQVGHTGAAPSQSFAHQSSNIDHHAPPMTVNDYIIGGLLATNLSDEEFAEVLEHLEITPEDVQETIARRTSTRPDWERAMSHQQTEANAATGSSSHHGARQQALRQRLPSAASLSGFRSHMDQQPSRLSQHQGEHVRPVPQTARERAELTLQTMANAPAGSSSHYGALQILRQQPPSASASRGISAPSSSRQQIPTVRPEPSEQLSHPVSPSAARNSGRPSQSHYGGSDQSGR